jgi:hypothetical protein
MVTHYNRGSDRKNLFLYMQLLLRYYGTGEEKKPPEKKMIKPLKGSFAIT